MNNIVLIQPAEVKRDEDGYWWHPDEPNFDEGQGAEMMQWIKDQGLEYVIDDLESEDDTHPAYINYFEKGECDISAWNPEHPFGEGWFTLSIHMTEDSVVWIWVRRIVQDQLETDDPHCNACHGTGEGQAPDSICPRCSGPVSRKYRGEP